MCWEIPQWSIMQIALSVETRRLLASKIVANILLPECEFFRIRANNSTSQRRVLPPD
jgi:hypothetical protein